MPAGSRDLPRGWPRQQRGCGIPRDRVWRWRTLLSPASPKESHVLCFFNQNAKSKSRHSIPMPDHHPDPGYLLRTWHHDDRKCARATWSFAAGSASAPTPLSRPPGEGQRRRSIPRRRGRPARPPSCYGAGVARKPRFREVGSRNSPTIWPALLIPRASVKRAPGKSSGVKVVPSKRKPWVP